MPWLLLVIIVIALIFDFLNGFHDASNIVATMISSRAVSPRTALILTAVSELAGPFLFGVAVATTIGSEVVNPAAITSGVIVAALLGAIIWNLITWYFGWPSSTSHALIGGLLGAVIVASGPETILLAGLEKVLLALFLSPVFGFLLAFLTLRITYFLARGATPRINTVFKRAQIGTAVALALSHGTNDAQKTMGMIAMAMVTTGYVAEFRVPWWVIAISAAAIALGTATGGWRLIETLGGRFYKIRPVHAFGSQIASASIILGAALLGGPVSTTQVASSAIMGAGSADRLSKVRWGVAREIAVAWLLTIPVAALLAAGLYVVVSLVVPS
ncbi:MAG: inorganic phosphate transporter [Anaerolineaceae bacterium]|jgi:PiT family inorganic phosphate transporter|nr:inorganic phosphate transporter [Anaerolineae bacterium]MDX9830915.1 inorganic phosphate transporter [Anaerolineae bacterium]NLF13304.1 inorganic phosphate transporter [Anaerolineaceae bacterium]